MSVIDEPVRGVRLEVQRVPGGEHPSAVADADRAPAVEDVHELVRVGGVRREVPRVAPWKTRSGYRYCVEESIYLAPWATGRRLGGALLDRTLAECARLGIREVIAVLTSETGAPGSGSYHLHRSREFEVAGRLLDVGFEHETSLDTIIMQRALPDHPRGGNGTK
nr:hypothetical protein [Rhodococcus sp. W8901]